MIPDYDDYQDENGPVKLQTLVRNDPEWAANAIRQERYAKELAQQHLGEILNQLKDAQKHIHALQKRGTELVERSRIAEAMAKKVIEAEEANAKALDEIREFLREFVDDPEEHAADAANSMFYLAELAGVQARRGPE